MLFMASRSRPPTRFTVVLTQPSVWECLEARQSTLRVADRAGAGRQDMVFSSITFLFYFLPIFLAAYFLTPTIQAKNVVTLLFSLVFYAWGEPRFVIVLLLSIVFNFCAGLLIDAREGSSRRLALGSRSPETCCCSGSSNTPISSPPTPTLLESARRAVVPRPTLRCRSASRFSPSIACPTSSTSTADGLGPIATRSTSRSTFPCFRNSLRDRSFATRPSRANWTPAGSRWAELPWARGSSSSASPRRCWSPMSSRRWFRSRSTRPSSLDGRGVDRPDRLHGADLF